MDMKERPICYAAHLDAAIYSFYSFQLSQRYESRIAEFSDSVLAYRSLGKSNIHFAKDAFDDIRNRGECVALAFDVSGFFDNLDHRYLKERWCEVIGGIELPEPEYKVFRSVTRYSQVNRDEVYEQFGLNSQTSPKKHRICTSQQFRTRVRDKGLITVNDHANGIPQGSPISATLSNVYMLEFDRKMHQLVNTLGGSYRRYSDDILWIGRVDDAEEVEKRIRELAISAHLELKEDKTDRVQFVREGGRLIAKSDEGHRDLQYLGFTFDGERARVRSSSISRFYRKMKQAVRSKAKAAKDSGDFRLFKRSLYENYSHLGKRNFISYVYRAAEIFGDEKIKAQVRNHWDALQIEIEAAEKWLEKEVKRTNLSNI
ncbi:reverse transcriptase (RNA-dependent DNA polymerase) [Bradymonas sediminis]|nr:reverse transcriptase (RNA-dependent DNA polymerase) [Bradymonas sediminis]